MPNWCENDLTVSGSKEAVEEFLKFAAGESPFDFNRFIRYPEEYRRLDELAKAWDREHEGRPDYDWCARPKDGFNSGGYEWRVANWGTKWPAFHVDVEEPVTGCDEGAREVVFHVDTPSSPPTPVIVEKPVTSDDEKTLEVVFHFDRVEPAHAGHRESRPTLPGVALRAALLRVRHGIQRALLLQRGRGRVRRERPVFRQPGWVSPPPATGEHGE